MHRELKPGERVVLTELPAGLVDGLPEEEQRAITAIIGEPVLLEGFDDDGRAELQFADSEGTIHFIYVDRKLIKPAK
jgi:hypothetical protein